MIKFDIDTGDAAPIKLSVYRVPQSEEKILREAVDKLLADKMIEPSISAWGFPMFLVKKKDGSLHSVVSYIDLNNVTRIELYPLPMIDRCFVAL